MSSSSAFQTGPCPGFDSHDLDVLIHSPDVVSRSKVWPETTSGVRTWRAAECWRETQIGWSDLDGLCGFCHKRRAILSRRKTQPTAPGVCKFVPLSKRNHALHVPSRSDEEVALEYVRDLLRQPADSLAQFLQTCFGAEGDFFVKVVAAVLAKIARPKAHTPPLLSSILLVHLSNHGSAALKVLRSLLPVPHERTVRRQMKRALSAVPPVSTGLNPMLLHLARKDDEMVLVMDGTRVIRWIDFIPGDGRLVGMMLPADCSKWNEDTPTIFNKMPSEVETIVAEARAQDAVASEVYVCCSQVAKQLLPLAVFPQPKANFSGEHLGILVLRLMSLVADHGCFCSGLSTDSEARAQSAFRKLLQPPPAWLRSSGARVVRARSSWMQMVAVVISGRTIACHYPDGNHILRAANRAFTNPLNILRLHPPAKTKTTDEFSSKDVTRADGVAHVSFLRLLRARGKLPHTRAQDMHPHVKLHPDAAIRIFSEETVTALQQESDSMRGLLFYIRLIVLITAPYRRTKASPSAAEAISSSFHGLTMLRVWRMSLLRYGMRLASGRKNRETGSFVSTALYFALEELAQNMVLRTLFLCAVAPEKYRVTEPISFTEHTTDRLEYSFGRRRTSNRISGEQFTTAELCHELHVGIVHHQERLEALRAGAHFQHTAKKSILFGQMDRDASAETLSASAGGSGTSGVSSLKKTLSSHFLSRSLQSYAPVSCSFALRKSDGAAGDASVASEDTTVHTDPLLEPATTFDVTKTMTFDEIQRCVEEAIEEGVARGLADCMEVPAWKELYGSREEMRSELCSFPRALARVMPPQSYPTDVVIQNLDDFANTSASEAIWQRRYELFDAQDNADATEDLGVDDEGGAVLGEAAEGDNSRCASAREACTFVRSFVRDGLHSQFIGKNNISWNAWKSFMADCNSLREWVSKDKYRRFAAGLMPGNVRHNDLTVLDLCLFRAHNDRRFVGQVAAIHDGTDDVNGIVWPKDNVWLSVAGLTVGDNGCLSMDAIDNTVTMYDARKHIVQVLKPAERFFDDATGTVTPALLDLLRSAASPVTKEKDGNESQEVADVSEDTGAEASHLDEASILRQLDELDQMKPVVIKKLRRVFLNARGQRMCYVDFIDGTSETVPAEDVPGTLLEQFEATGRQRMPAKRDADHLYGAELEDAACEAPSVSGARHHLCLVLATTNVDNANVTDTEAGSSIARSS